MSSMLFNQEIIMNEALIKQVGLAKKKNPEITNLTIAIATGIHRSTVSQHLNSEKKLSIDHAREYSDFLKIPLIKVIDDYTVKYRIVKYLDEFGEVHNPSEEDFDVIVAPNELETSHQYCIYDKERNDVYWYDPKQTCNNSNVLNKYTFIITENKSYLGVVTKFVDKDITFINIHTQKTLKEKCNICYPMTGITFCDFATLTKMSNSL